MRGIERQSKMINKNRENHQTVWVVDDDQGILDVVKIIFEQECFPGKYFSDPKLMQAEISRETGQACCCLMCLCEVSMALILR